MIDVPETVWSQFDEDWKALREYMVKEGHIEEDHVLVDVTIEVDVETGVTITEYTAKIVQ